MAHNSPLIAILVIGLGLAFVFGTIANRLKLSPLVGYLLAGIAIGPFTPGFVADRHLTLAARRCRRDPADVRRRSAFLAARSDVGAPHGAAGRGAAGR